MLEPIHQKLEICRLQAEIMRLNKANDQLKTELSDLQKEYDRYRSNDFLRRDDFLQTAIKSLVANGSITDNRQSIHK